MPHSKKPKLTHDAGDSAAAAATAASIPSDQLANIFGCLGPKEILPLRGVCTKWNEAVKNTIVPLAPFGIGGEQSYNIMRTMSSALPNLQKLKLGYVYKRVGDVKFADGEDPDERQARDTANHTTYDIDMVSNFTKLREFELSGAPLNGSYPYLFNFPLLQKLTVSGCHRLKWDLAVLAGFPLLKEFHCESNKRMTGNIYSLRALKDTLEKVIIVHCPQIDGNFMDLADFPHLKSLKLRNVDKIKGDIRGMGETSFPKIETLALPAHVYGGNGFKFMRASDAKDLIATIYSIKKQRNRHPSLFEDHDWYLSEDSPDWYEDEIMGRMCYPFSCCIVRAGSRLGWRWERKYDYTPDHCFEVNWLDSLPAKGSSEYQSYIQGLQELESYMNRFPFFRGYRQPPSEAVFKRLERMYRPSQEEMEIYENL